MKSAYPLVYYIAKFEKTGSQFLVADFKIQDISLKTLQKIFDIDSNDPDPVNRDLAYCYEITEKEALLLKKHVNFEFDKYDYTLEGRGDYTLSDDTNRKQMQLN